MLGNDVVLCIVGNKIDLEKDRHVSVQTAEEYARSVNAKLYHTSAKLNKGIEELFNDLASRKYLIKQFLERFVWFFVFPIKVYLKKFHQIQVTQILFDQVVFLFNHLQQQIRLLDKGMVLVANEFLFYFVFIYPENQSLYKTEYFFFFVLYDILIHCLHTFSHMK